MKISKIKVQYINELLNEVKDNRDKVIDLMYKLCPRDIEKCDTNLELSDEATTCPYFTLCNVMSSYALLSEEEQEEEDAFIEMFRHRVKQKTEKPITMYA